MANGTTLFSHKLPPLLASLFRREPLVSGAVKKEAAVQPNIRSDVGEDARVSDPLGSVSHSCFNAHRMICARLVNWSLEKIFR